MFVYQQHLSECTHIGLSKLK